MMSFLSLVSPRGSPPPRRIYALFFCALAMCLTLTAGAAHSAGKAGSVHRVIGNTSGKVPVAKKHWTVRPARRPQLRRRSAPRHCVESAFPDRLELLDFNASAAYVVDADSNEVLLGKNATAMMPIASLTKLMTAVVIADSQLALDQEMTITEEDVDRVKKSGSRLSVGTVLTRGQALHLSLMSSENRAAHALARTYPGGESAFVNAMNVKAREFGMRATRFVEPTGLSSDNRSTARDLAVLAAQAAKRPLLRRLSTSPAYRLAVDGRTLRYVNSNGLVHGRRWDIDLQKTGYIREAGYNLLMTATLSGRKLILVFLDSASKVTRIRDAERVRRWLERRSRAGRQSVGTAKR